MAQLVVGGLPIPVSASSASWTRIEATDRVRAFDNTYRSSATGGVAKDYSFTTPPVVRATGDIYAAQLGIIAAQMCSGDIIGLPTMCCAEITNPEALQRLATGHAVQIQFVLHEVQGAKTLLRYTPGDTITGESFTRSTTGRFYNAAGVVGTEAINAKRENHYISGVRSLLLENTRTNLVIQSENFGATWVATGTPTRTPADNTSSSVTLDLIGDDSAAAVEGYQQVITFTGNAVKAISLFVAQGSSASSVIRLEDLTAGTDRLRATLTWSGGLPVVTMTTGTFLGYETLTSCFRLKFATTSVTAANTNQLELYPATNAALAAANTGTLDVGGVMAENASFPSMYIPTTTATVARGVEAYSLPFTSPPQEMTVYVRFVEGRTNLNPDARVFQISDAANANPQFLVDSPSGFYRVQHSNGSSFVNSALATTPAIGDVVELCLHLFGDGSVDITQSINSGAATSGAQSAALSFAPAWSGPLVWPNSAGTVGAVGFIALRSFKIVAGSHTLTEMRVA